MSNQVVWRMISTASRKLETMPDEILTIDITNNDSIPLPRRSSRTPRHIFESFLIYRSGLIHSVDSYYTLSEAVRGHNIILHTTGFDITVVIDE